MQGKPLVSTIIPVYDGERYLAEAIESILAQTYRPIEVIIADDGSTDSSAGIACSYKEVRYLFQTNQGHAAARNVGIRAARGELIAFLDADDLWTADKLSIQVGYLIDHPEIQYTIARVKFFLEPGCHIPSGFRKKLLRNDHVGRLIPTLVARRSLFDAFGKFNPNSTTAEDVDWFARANDSGIPMAIIPRVLLYKRVHDTNLSINAPTNNQDLLKVLKQSIHRKRSRGLAQERLG